MALSMFRCFAFLVLLFLCSCRSSLAPVWKIDEYDPVSSDERGHLIGILTEAAREVRSARLLIQGAVRRGIGRESFTSVLVFQRPTKLRLEFFEPGLNRLALQVIVNGKSLDVVDLRGQNLYRGTPSVSLIERMLLVPLSSEELILWFCGRFSPPASSSLVDVEARRDALGGRHFLRYRLKDDRVIVVAFASDEAGTQAKLKLSALEVRSADGSEVRFSSQFDYAGEVPLPRRIKFWVPAQDLEGEIEYKRVVMNPDLRSQAALLFSPQPPSGLTWYDLDRSPAVSPTGVFEQLLPPDSAPLN